VLAKHPFLNDDNHKLEVRRNTVEVFHADGRHWFSQEYFMAPTSACKSCGGRGFPAREDGWARLCHACSKDKVLLHPSCGPDGTASRFTTVVVDKEDAQNEQAA